ncbi:hypothetical protein ACFLZX_02385 [Nanoarchaeota archaeon]
MILEITQAIIGLALGLFIPGYILSLIILKKISKLERVAVSFGLSIAIDILIGLFLGLNETMRSLTGGITTLNVYLYLTVVSIVLGIIYFFTSTRKT